MNSIIKAFALSFLGFLLTGPLMHAQEIGTLRCYTSNVNNPPSAFTVGLYASRVEFDSESSSTYIAIALVDTSEEALLFQIAGQIQYASCDFYNSHHPLDGSSELVSATIQDVSVTGIRNQIYMTVIITAQNLVCSACPDVVAAPHGRPGAEALATAVAALKARGFPLPPDVVTK